MLKKALHSVVIAASLALSLPHIAWGNEINTKALDLAGQQKFDQALRLLSQQDAKLRAGYEHRFLKARIHSWAGQYSDARRELNSLMAAYPDNADLQLAMGNLEYYQQNLTAAERHYVAVLDKFPEYQDARTGLENVRKARKEAAANGNHSWRLDSSLGFSDFDQDDLTDWDNQFFRVEYAPKTLAYHASVQRYKRFDTTNVQFQGGVSDAVRGGWDWGLEAGFTPSALFRPDFSVGGRLGRALTLQNGTVIYPSTTYRYDDYASGGIHNIQPDITAYLDKDIVLTARLIATLQESENDQFGWLVQGRIPASEKLQLNIGYANAPEAVDGIAITTESLFGGLTYTVRDDLDVHLNLARDDREDTYIRNSINVGFTHKR